jgi:hypothetical protein
LAKLTVSFDMNLFQKKCRKLLKHGPGASRQKNDVNKKYVCQTLLGWLSRHCRPLMRLLIPEVATPATLASSPQPPALQTPSLPVIAGPSSVASLPI